MRKLQPGLPHFLRRPNFATESRAPPVFREKIQTNSRLLACPKTDRQLLLIGTMNASPFLAHKTLQTLKDYKPDSLLVQANPDWYDKVAHALRGVENPTQSEVFGVKYNHMKHFVAWNVRDTIFNIRFWSWFLFFSEYLGLKSKNANAFRPGLEVFLALKEAKEKQIKVDFADSAFGDTVQKAFEQEKRMDLPWILLRILKKPNNLWSTEVLDFFHLLANRGLAAFSENLDDKSMLWLNSYLQLIFPYQKKIFIDEVSEVLFRKIAQNPSKRMAAIVNQWHVPQLTYFWENFYQVEKFHEGKDPINPVGDFDIEEHIKSNKANYALQRFHSRVSNSEPATMSMAITGYIKQSTEFERERHAFFQGHDDPELEHALFNGENDHVENMPYKVEHH